MSGNHQIPQSSLRFSMKLLHLLGIPLFFHWTQLFVPLSILVYFLVYTTWENALLNLAVFSLLQIAIFIHQMVRVICGYCWQLKVRDIFFYPICGMTRLTRLSERPKHELMMYFYSDLFLILILTVLYAALLQLGFDLQQIQWSNPFPWTEVFWVRFFYLFLIYVFFNLTPAFPFDLAYILRAANSFYVGRQRSTLITGSLGTFLALLFMIIDLIWIQNGLLGALSIFLFIMNQHEILVANQFAEVRKPPIVGKGRPISMVSIEKIFDPDSKPIEPNFNGFTWNERTRIWIEWKNGEPVCGSAVLGD